MNVIKQNLGIDVDSKELKVSLQFLTEDLSIKIKGSRTFKNTVKGFQSLEGWLKKKMVNNLALNITMEATGVYYENLAYYFEERAGNLVHVVLPNTSKSYLKSLNLKSKTDEIDAKGLGKMGLERKLKVWKPISDQMRDIKKMVRERVRLTREKTMVINQLHAELASYLPNSKSVTRYNERIDFLKKQIKSVEKDLVQKVNKDEKLKQRIAHVCTIKGVQFITAIGVIAEYNGFVLFENRNQVVSFAGYDVIKNESGTSVRGRTKMSKKGNSYVRQMLYMCAMSAARLDDHHRVYYSRIVNKTGIKMKGNVAIQRKLLLLIYTLFKNNTHYDSEHAQKTRDRIAPKSNKVIKKRTEEILL
jgi:transposase